MEEKNEKPFRERGRLPSHHLSRLQRSVRSTSSTWSFDLADSCPGWSASSAGGFKELAQPTALNDDIASTLRRRMQRDFAQQFERDEHGRKLLQALPCAPLGARASRKQATASAMRDRLQAWLQSPEAADWRAHRERMFLPEWLRMDAGDPDELDV